MPRPSFARYAALLAGVLDTSGSEAGCADVRADGDGPDGSDGSDARAHDWLTLDQATRRAAWSLRRPVMATMGERPSAMDPTYRDRVATPPASPDARLDRRG